MDQVSKTKNGNSRLKGKKAHQVVSLLPLLTRQLHSAHT